MDLKVSLPPSEVAQIISIRVTRSISAELVDQYEFNVGDVKCIVQVFEKYFMRNSSCASLTVTISGDSSSSYVHAIGSGGSQGVIFKIDWGASANFESEVEAALEGHIISR